MENFKWNIWWNVCVNLGGFMPLCIVLKLTQINEFWRFCMCQLITILIILFFYVLQVNEMASTRISCKNKPDIFCYFCGEYTIIPSRNLVSMFKNQVSKCAYHAYFGVKFGNQDEAGCHTWYESHATSICVSEPKARRVIPWSGGSYSG